MVSLFQQGNGLTFAEVQALWQPSYFGDLNLDAFTAHFRVYDYSVELIPYFYYTAGRKEHTVYRQELMKDLADPDVRAAVGRFITGISVAERYQSCSEMVTSSVQRSKWRLDTILRFYETLEQFCLELNYSHPKSQALYDVHRYLSDILQKKEVVELRQKAEEINAEFEKLKFHITINKERATLDFGYSDEDYCSNIRTEFAKSEENAGPTFTESPFGDMNISPLEEFILNQFMKQDRLLFRNLETFCGINRQILDPGVQNLVREFRFYLLNLEIFEKMRERNFPIAFPEIIDTKEICLTDCYDILLAEKNHEQKKEVILNDIQKAESETAFILTGPNQGGKTTLARALGQSVYFAMMGFPVAASTARLPFIDEIFTQFASITGDGVEGRLEHELTGAKEILGKETGNSLIIFNELFTSAPTVDALEMTRSLLKMLLSHGNYCFVVTHTFELSYDSPDYISLVATVVEDGSYRRTYRIVRKKADGVAYANSIVSKYKLDYDNIRYRVGKRQGAL